MLVSQIMRASSTMFVRPVAVAFVLLVSANARAHFILSSPENIKVQDGGGNPQKSPPCGGNGMNTNAVTEVETGSMISITIDETLTHPGHYRVSLAQTQGDLPADPTVTPGAGDECATLAIEPNPQLPLLADGLLQHTTAFSGPQTVMVQLPADMTCTNCVLQVVQYMRKHPAPCFYHHCATVTITDNPAPAVDGTVPGDDAGATPGGDDPSGGCCSTNREDAPGAMLLGIAIAAVGLLRRRRRN